MLLYRWIPTTAYLQIKVDPCGVELHFLRRRIPFCIHLTLESAIVFYTHVNWHEPLCWICSPICTCSINVSSIFYMLCIVYTLSVEWNLKRGIIVSTKYICNLGTWYLSSIRVVIKCRHIDLWGWVIQCIATWVRSLEHRKWSELNMKVTYHQLKILDISWADL